MEGMHRNYRVALVAIGLVVVFVAGFIVYQSSRNDTATALQHAVDRVIPMEPGYESVPFSTTNYGLVSMYTAPSAQDMDFYCDTWNCLGVPDDAIPQDPDELMSIQGLASVGRGSPIELTVQEQEEYSLNVLLPEVANALGGNVAFDSSAIERVDLRIGSAVKRELRRREFFEFMTERLEDANLRRMFEAGDITVIVGDIVVSSMTLEVQFSSEASAQVETSAPVPASAEGSASLSFGWARVGAGRYVLTVDTPLIVRRIAKRPSSDGTLSPGDSDDEWVGWETVVAPF
jgi:hypothetical protein